MRNPEEYRGNPIRSLQTMLRTISKNGAPIPPVVPDGIFGQDTEDALRAFQKHAGLSVTGKTDLDTWQALTKHHDRARVFSAPAEPLHLILQPNQVIAPGERNHHLNLMQAMFLVLGDHYAGVPKVRVTGIHDAETQAAVRWLRQAALLPDATEIDRDLWRHLAHLYRATAQDGTGRPVF